MVNISSNQHKEVGKVCQSWCLQWRIVGISGDRSSSLVEVLGRETWAKWWKKTPHLLVTAPGSLHSPKCWVQTFSFCTSFWPRAMQQGHLVKSGCRRQTEQIWLLGVKEKLCPPWVKSRPAVIQLTSDKLPSRTTAKANRKEKEKEKLGFCPLSQIWEKMLWGLYKFSVVCMA